MKIILLLIILFIGFVSFAQAQRQPLPPPAPLIFKAPSEAELKKFISSDDGFEVVFPGDPVMKETEKAQQKIRIFSTYKNGSHSVVQISSYPKEKPVRDFYEEMRANIVRYPDATIESEIDAKLGSVSGKEFAVLTGFVYRRMRIFISGNKVYTVAIDVTNWHLLKDMEKEKVTEFQKEADRFLNSFRISG